MDKTHIIRRVSSTPENFIMYKTLVNKIKFDVNLIKAWS